MNKKKNTVKIYMTCKNCIYDSRCAGGEKRGSHTNCFVPKKENNNT